MKVPERELVNRVPKTKFLSRRIVGDRSLALSAVSPEGTAANLAGVWRALSR